jgi:hypothetical protein
MSQEPRPWNCESPKEKCPMVVPRDLQNHVVWSWILKCSVEWYVTEPSTKCYFDDFLFMWILTHDKSRIYQWFWAFEMPWSPRFVLGLPQEVVFENSPSDHETWSIWCHVGIYVYFTSILHSHTLLVPQAYCEANLDQLRIFHQWECLKCNGHGLPVSCVKWPSCINVCAFGSWLKSVGSQSLDQVSRPLDP